MIQVVSGCHSTIPAGSFNFSPGSLDFAGLLHAGAIKDYLLPEPYLIIYMAFAMNWQSWKTLIYVEDFSKMENLLFSKRLLQHQHENTRNTVPLDYS